MPLGIVLLEFCEFSLPVFARVPYPGALDGVRSHVPSPDLQGDHGQREREHDFPGFRGRQEEFVIGHGPVELAPDERRRQLHMIPLIVDLPIRCGHFHQQLVSGLSFLRSGGGRFGQQLPVLADRQRGTAKLSLAQPGYLTVLGRLAFEDDQRNRLRCLCVLQQLSPRPLGSLAPGPGGADGCCSDPGSG